LKGDIEAMNSTDLDFWRPAGLERWPWIEALVTTRRGGMSPAPYASLNLGLSSGDRAEHVHANRERLRRGLGLSSAQLHLLQQVHGTSIWEVPGGATTQGDGLTTRAPGTVLVVGVADCVPAFVWDARRRCISLVHAGWRGTAAGILGLALARLLAEGSRAGDLWVALGPCIGPCCYAVSPEVAARFPAAAVTQRDEQVHLDLRVANRLQALAAGLADEQVQATPPCTGCHPELFFSYRKEAQRTGRMWALLWMREPEVRPLRVTQPY
jgi:YfiH family protein